MKFQYMSDLHIAFHGDKGLGFLKEEDKCADTLVLAGDIGEMHLLFPFLMKALDMYSNVVYTPGNHEYYNHGMKYVDDLLEEFSEENENFHLLQNSHVEIEGQRFIGGTLWFPDSDNVKIHKHRFPDFLWIHGFGDEVFKRNSETRQYLMDNVEHGDVVVTHHAPSFRSVVPKYSGSPINDFFVGCAEEVLTKGVVWVQGHMHSQFEYAHLGSFVVCNPFGYTPYEDVGKFNERAVLDPKKQLSELAENPQKWGTFAR